MSEEAWLRRANPWWENPSAIQLDTKIVDWTKSAIKYDPVLRHEIQYDFEPDNTVIYTVRGPRQVGKTTMIKLQIKDLLDRGVQPWNIFYYSLDLSSTPRDIVNMMEIYLKISKRQRGENRSYVFLDEASSVPDWQKGIKFLVDVIGLPNCTVLVTGSHSINIKHATERLPGRRGRTDSPYDNILLPMKFAEYSTLDEDMAGLIRENELQKISKREKIFKALLNGKIPEEMYALYSSQNAINDLLDEYMVTGGLPIIVHEKYSTNIIRNDSYKNYLDSIVGQWADLSKNEGMLRQFAGTVVKNLCKHTSWTSLAKDAELGSMATARDYTDTLHSMFVLSVIDLYGEEKKRPRFRNDRKIYFQDPFFLHLFNGWTGAESYFESSLKYRDDRTCQGGIVEGIVADHLIRWAFSTSKNKQVFDYRDHVFYWKDDKKREVDFILYDRDRAEIPIEVKFRNDIKSVDLAPMSRFLSKTGNKRGLVLSKTRLETKQDYTVIPASLFLLLI